jgi:predicted metal-dependent hydrolase
LTITWSSVRFKALQTHPDLPLPVQLCPIRTARRMRLRVDERKRILKLTHPRGVRPAAALAWAASQKQWVEEQLDSILPPEPLVAGAVIPILGEDVEICWSEHAPRTPSLVDSRLVCGGAQAGLERRIQLFLKRLAVETLSLETAEIACRAAVRPVSVAVGDARTRWGSCSSNGKIRYNWRLILASPEARRYVVAHEVAHLTHLNHGAKFKALERDLFGGDTRTAEALLRSESPRLRRIGLGR